MTTPSDHVRDAVNSVLHRNTQGSPAPCATACTHVIVGRWTALGIANVIARQDARERDR